MSVVFFLITLVHNSAANWFIKNHSSRLGAKEGEREKEHENKYNFKEETKYLQGLV